MEWIDILIRFLPLYGRILMTKRLKREKWLRCRSGQLYHQLHVEMCCPVDHISHQAWHFIILQTRPLDIWSCQLLRTQKPDTRAARPKQQQQKLCNSGNCKCGCLFIVVWIAKMSCQAWPIELLSVLHWTQWRSRQTKNVTLDGKLKLHNNNSLVA